MVPVLLAAVAQICRLRDTRSSSVWCTLHEVIAPAVVRTACCPGSCPIHFIPVAAIMFILQPRVIISITLSVSAARTFSPLGNWGCLHQRRFYSCFLLTASTQVWALVVRIPLDLFNNDNHNTWAAAPRGHAQEI